MLRGFDSYTLAYFYSIGVDDPVNDLCTEISLDAPPPYPDDHTYNQVPPSFPKDVDYDMSAPIHEAKVPSDVSYSHQSQVSTSSDFHTGIMKERNLPKYSGTEDLSIFLHKLKPLLYHPDINNCHLDTITTHEHVHYLSNQAALLRVCLEGNALALLLTTINSMIKGLKCCIICNQMLIQNQEALLMQSWPTFIQSRFNPLKHLSNLGNVSEHYTLYVPTKWISE